MNAEELKAAFANLPDFTPATKWDEHRLSLRKHVAKDDLNKFLAWSTVTATMFVGEAPYIEQEFLTLMAKRDYWERALFESFIGKPPRLSYAPWTSGNLVHQAYHLKQWMDKTELDIRDLQWIVEFGGGYGAMAKIAYNLGFHGVYTLVDFPEFLFLQEHYLSTHGIEAEYVSPANASHLSGDPDLFIALFSLSEAPIGTRFAVLPSAASYLFAYQPQWDDINNTIWFSVLRQMRQDTRWWNWQAKHKTTYTYMVGV